MYKDPERRKQYYREYRRTNKEDILIKSRIFNKTPARRQYMKERRLKTYGLSVDEWQKLFEAQGSKCACCATTCPGRRGWQTDHDHDTGAVRGIICLRCNRVLGMLGDSALAVISLCESMRRYLCF